MADNVTVYNSPLTNYDVRTTKVPSGVNVNKDIQHVFVDAPFITRQDDVSAAVTYYGWALPGSSVASAVWRILKKDVSGTETFYLYADGNTDFDNIWNNRAVLSYS